MKQHLMTKVSLTALFSCLLCVYPVFSLHAQRQMPQRQAPQQPEKAAMLPAAHTYANLPVGPAYPDPLPSGVQGPPMKPPSTDRLTLDGDAVSNQVAEVEAGVEARMRGIHIGTGDLSTPQASDETLKAALAHDAKMRQIAMLRSEVDASIGLWGAAYAGPREDAKTGTPIVGPSAMIPSAPIMRAPPVDPSIARKQAKEDAKREREEAQAQAQADAEAHNQAVLDEIAGRKRALGQIPPVVSSIYGSSKAPKAFILVPYMGSVEVTHVGQTFSLIDNSIMKITALSVDGVYASHNGGPPRRIGNGSSVPTAADAVSMFNAISSDDVKSATTQGMQPQFAPPMSNGAISGSGMPPGMNGLMPNMSSGMNGGITPAMSPAMSGARMGR